MVLERLEKQLFYKKINFLNLYILFVKEIAFQSYVYKEKDILFYLVLF